MGPSPDEPRGGHWIVVQIQSSAGFAVTALVGITLAFYHGLWLQSLVLIKRDAFRYFLPLKQYVVERLATAELPQWFPYEALGCPFIGASGIGVFHPFTALLFLLPVPDVYRASILLSCLLAALGTFTLGRMLNFSHAGALLAGLAFTLSGYVVSLTDNLLYLYSICVLPLFCAGLEKALRDGRMYAVAPAALWATVFLNGDIQTGYYYIFIGLLWATARAPESYQEAWLRLGLTGVLAALLAGIQLGPAWAVFVDSERAQSALFQKEVLLWSTHPLRLVTVLASPVGQDADPVALARSFFGTSKGGFWAESLYLGVPVLGLACLGAWHRRDLRALALLGGFALLLALGQFGVLYEIFYQVVPLWSAFRYPEKFMGVVSFAVAMLSGAGLDAVRAGKSHPATWLTAASLCVCMGLILFTRVAGWWVAGTFGVTEAFARSVTASAAQASLFSAAAALGMALVVAGLNMGGALRSRLLLACLIAIIPLDLSRANLGVYHTGPVEAATFTPPLAEALRTREGSPGPGRFRLVTISEDILVLPQDFMQSLGFYGASSVERRQALDVEHNAQFHLETAMPYLSGFSTRFEEMLNPRTGIEAAARLNAKYYIGRRYHLKDPRLAKGLVAELPPYDLALFENPVPAKPRAYLSQRPERATLLVDPMALFMRPDFLNGDVDVIETTDVTLPGPARGGSAAIERYAPEDVRVHTETPQPAVLILLDAFDQGWTATLENGAELPILRANALVRAVVVPGGDHTATFRYETPLLRVGAAASFAGMLLCLGLIVHGRWRRHAALTAPSSTLQSKHDRRG